MYSPAKLQNHMKPFHPDDAIILFLDNDVVITVDSRL